jgi:ABC-type thiamine transport system ATPase subunit
MQRRSAMGVLRRVPASTLMLGASAVSHAADPAVLSIPVVTPLSGPTSVIGQDTAKSIDIAMRYIADDGGVLGRKLEFKIVDTQGKPDSVIRILLFAVVGAAAGSLSGGLPRMLAIGCALMAWPKLVMLDEPTLGLAPVIVDEIYIALGKLRPSGLTILLVERDVRMALALVDRAYVPENGAIALSGAADALCEVPRVRDVYLGLQGCCTTCSSNHGFPQEATSISSPVSQASAAAQIKKAA